MALFFLFKASLMLVSSVIIGGRWSFFLTYKPLFRIFNSPQSEFLSFHREKIIGQEIKEERQSGQKNTADKEHFS